MFDKVALRKFRTPTDVAFSSCLKSRHDPNQTLRAAWNHAEAANFSGRLQLSEQLLSYIG
jgi:hypothetical protein